MTAEHIAPNGVPFSEYTTWDDVENKNYVVTILWGSDGDVSQTYGFNTVGELDAFLHGVEEACGWHSYEVESSDV